MRGKATAPAGMEIPTRITPAYAGKRPRFCWAALYRQDHPRLCGEKSLIWRLPETSTGSPPPMRGKETTIHHNRSGFRITPAYAGKRPGRIVRQAQTRDHPRLCGEKCRRIEHHDEFERITPAYAGKSRLFEIVNVNHEDHPRLCGEKCNFHVNVV